MSVLAVSGLCKSFGGVRAVDGVTFAVGRGEFLALIGPNGAGKSTCFNMINGQLRPDDGDIRLDGNEHRRAEAAPHRRAGRRPHLSGCRDFRLDDGGRERADGAASRQRAKSIDFGGAAARHRPRRWNCCGQVGMADAAPIVPAASLPMAT